MNPQRRQNGILVHNVDDEVVVYDKARKEAHRLNQTVSAVWDLLDGQRSAAEMAAELGVDQSIVSLSIDELAKAGLLETGDALSVSRRSALRRVASAAAVGLLFPAVTSIAAPMAAQAESRRGGGSTGGSFPNPYDAKGSDKGSDGGSKGSKGSDGGSKGSGGSTQVNNTGRRGRRGGAKGSG